MYHHIGYRTTEICIHSFLTSVLDGVEWSNTCLCHFTTRDKTPVPIEQEVGWAPELHRTFWRQEKSLALSGITSHTTHPTA